MHRLMILAAFIMLPLAVVAAQDDADSALIDGPPPIETQVYGETAEGYIFLANFNRNRPDDVEPDDWQRYRPHLLIVDNAGEIVWQMELPRRASGFRTLPNGNLIYHDFQDRGYGSGVGVDGPFIEMTPAGEVVREYRMEGYSTSLHQILFLENGNFLTFSYDSTVRDMSAYGGAFDAVVIDGILQEITPLGAVVWVWSALDHIPFEATTRPDQLENIPPRVVDAVHPNGMAIDIDGDLLLSNKHLDAINKIDRATGEIEWSIGHIDAPMNDFTFIDDPLNGFSAQHAPVILENGNLLLFDNGFAHEPRVSRAVEYELDRDNRTARLVWEYVGESYAAGLGSVQRLPNGNTLIGWGAAPGVSVSEVTPAGEVVFELTLPETQMNYQAFRLPFEPVGG